MKKSSKKTSKKPLKKPLKKTPKKASKKPLRKPLKKPSTKLLKKPAKKLTTKISKKPSKKPSRKPSPKKPLKPLKKPLWIPSEVQIKNANMTRFIEFVNGRFGKKFGTYDDLYQWSVDFIPDFWVAMWEFAEVKASRKWDQVAEDLKKFPGTKWFPGAKLNFAENLLR